MRRLWHPDLDQVSLDRALSALGDPVRLSMVRTLADGREHLRGDFAVDVGPSTLSHHARTLREAGIARSRQESTRCFLSLRPEFETRFPGLLGVILDQGAGAELEIGSPSEARGALPTTAGTKPALPIRKR